MDVVVQVRIIWSVVRLGIQSIEQKQREREIKLETRVRVEEKERHGKKQKTGHEKQTNKQDDESRIHRGCKTITL